MRYTGNKSRIAKYILPIILKDRKPNQWFVEPFVGGANITDKVEGFRLASDYNKHLIKFYKALQDGWTPPLRISKSQYEIIKQNQEQDSKMTVWAGICCSYGGKWFGGYLSDYQESKRLKNGKLPNHQDEARRGLITQIPNLMSVHFIYSDYKDLDIPPNSIIYCDPPYEGTVKYKNGINHFEFWEWCRNKSKEGHIVFVSEYNAPIDFECVWEMELSNTLSKQNNFKSVEKLFKFSPTNVQ
jgi:DNA adenine methylase